MIIFAVFVILAVAFAAFTYWQNTSFTLTSYEYCNARVPDSMDGFRIVQVSDLHNQTYGPGNSHLLKAIQDCKPDAIMITGDLIDSSFTNTEVAIAFVTAAVRIAPVYYCTGNHEHRLSEQELQDFLSELSRAGCTVLRDEAVSLGAARLIGLRDPSAKGSKLQELMANMDRNQFTILLAHKPHYFKNYTDADLILSGHAHGGQARLPWIGGIVAPGQGFFPEYTDGFYTMENATMLVSRGLGNSHRFPRFFNRPELVILTLRKKNG